MKILMLIKKYIVLIVVILLLVGFGAFKFLKKKSEGKQKEALDILEDLGYNSGTPIVSTAMQIAHHLGTAYPWYDPRSLTENDKEVYDLIKYLSQEDFNVCTELYFKVYAKGRNLSSDLVKLLDKKYYKLLTIK